MMVLLKNSFDCVKNIVDDVIILDLKNPLKKSFENVYYLPSTRIRYENYRIFNNKYGRVNSPYIQYNTTEIRKPISAFITNTEGARYIPYLRYLDAKIYTFDYQETLNFILLPPGVSYFPSLSNFDKEYIANMRATLINFITKKKVMYNNDLINGKRDMSNNSIYNNKNAKVSVLMGDKDKVMSVSSNTNPNILPLFMSTVSRFLDDKDVAKSLNILVRFIDEYYRHKTNFSYRDFEDKMIYVLNEFNKILDNREFVLLVYMFILSIL